nr:hypothetical protein HmN_000975700 [Hymenolepis microstoma]CUU98031.1 hypothetical transcript [Hymenolepis microstoma]
MSIRDCHQTDENMISTQCTHNILKRIRNEVHNCSRDFEGGGAEETNIAELKGAGKPSEIKIRSLLIQLLNFDPMQWNFLPIKTFVIDMRKDIIDAHFTQKRLKTFDLRDDPVLFSKDNF